MGKNGVKIQLPDAKKAAKAAKRAALQKLEDAVKEADALDPSEALAPFLAKPFVRNGLSTSVEAVPHASALSAADRKWMWNLLEKNMKPVYGAQAWKKEGKEKKRGDAERRRAFPRRAQRRDAIRGCRKHRERRPERAPRLRALPLRHRRGRRGVVRVRAPDRARRAPAGPREVSHDAVRVARAQSESLRRRAHRADVERARDEVLRVHEVRPVPDLASNLRPVGVRGGRVRLRHLPEGVGRGRRFGARQSRRRSVQGEQRDVRRGVRLRAQQRRTQGRVQEGHHRGVTRHGFRE
mmetsp:Transcript_873/g.3652  ORF Transcript_873/g.3652 Transcript_873/m.3652 type:complete len:295 (-) Transcript_873:3-887(-)